MLDRQGRQGDEELLTAKDAEGAKRRVWVWIRAHMTTHQ